MFDVDTTSQRNAPARSIRRLRFAAVAAIISLVAPMVSAGTAGAASTPLATHSAPSTRAGATPTPDPQALPAQSANQPYAQQLIDRLSTIAPDTSDGAADSVAAAIDAGTPVDKVAGSVARSWPAIAEAISEDGYVTFLNRPIDPSGKAWITGQIASGHSVEWAFAALAASPEFRSARPTTVDQITAIYRGVLHRGPDSGGMTYFTNLLASGTPITSVVSTVTSSPEYASRLVTAAYPKLLLRTADPSGATYWRGQVPTIGQIGLETALAASPESQRFGCDPLASGSCMLPWPNNYYTRPDSGTATGLRVNLRASFLPVNSSGVPISPVQSNRSDGFSPGSTIMVQVPGIDVTASGLPTIDKLDLNGPNSPVVLLDTTDGSTVDTWSELDVHGPYPDPSMQPLLIHPVKNLTDGHHYVVALRNLKNASDTALAAPAMFAAFRDNTSSNVPGFAARHDHMDSLFSDLTTAGVQRSNLYLAWDFTVASTANLTGRLIHIRDDAFARLGTAAPAFTVTSSTTSTTPGIARVVSGTFSVPNYLTGTGAPGSTFNEDASGLPQVNGTFTAPFLCVIPTSALTTPARPSLYGHGLFGSNSEVTSGAVEALATEHNMVFCGTNWAGMSNDDLGTAAGILGNLSKFNQLADRLQQGVLNFLFLGRLMKLDSGLASDPAFQNPSGASTIATGQLYYDGNSQGGIEGGILTAVATDWTHSVLGVSAINYGMLLPRSTDFNTYEAVMAPAYPAEFDRVLGLALIQLQWDRGEPDGYANHMTSDPLPGTPSHNVLMQIAVGDHQVSNYAADTEARTIGAKTNCPSFDPGRVTDTRLLWHVPCISTFPYDGSAIIYYDSGSALPLLTDSPPTSGHDPHQDPRSDPQARVQVSNFLQPDGKVIDVCAGGPCHAAQH